MQDCAPLVLQRGKDTTWNFQGIEGCRQGNCGCRVCACASTRSRLRYTQTSVHKLASSELRTALSMRLVLQGTFCRQHSSPIKCSFKYATKYRSSTTFWVQSDDSVNPMKTRDICLRAEVRFFHVASQSNIKQLQRFVQHTSEASKLSLAL